MAFIGIFLVAVVFWALLAAVVIVFIPSLIIALINLIQGIRRHWPKRNIVLVSIFGSMAGFFILATLIIWLLAVVTDISNMNNSSSEMISLLFALIK